MEKTCFLFAGQGSQYPGMGQELLELFPTLSRIFEAGSDILGFDLQKACYEYEADALAKTEVSQPAIMAVSLIAYEAVRELGIEADCYAGHSLGEYAALTAAGALTLEDAFRVIKARAHAMGECAKGQNGAMAAVMADAAAITTVCESVREKSGKFVSPVNFNSPAQTVIAGEAPAVEAAMEEFTAMGKRSVKLAVSAAFHTPFMQPAADEFQAAVSGIPFRIPEKAFYSNTDGKVLEDWADMPGYLARHLVSPVYFVDELNAIHSSGVCRFIECGPNKVLSGLVRKTLDGVSGFNVENAKTFEKLKASLTA